jgi:hypothetical protein
MNVLYGLVNSTVPVTFEGENKDTLVLENVKDGSVLQVGPSLSPSTAPLSPGAPSQRFKLISKGEGYAFYSPCSKTCLDGQFSGLGSDLAASPASSSQGQNWYLDIQRDTVAKLRSVASPELLLSKEQGRLQLLEDFGSPSQLWNLLGL